MNYLLRFLSIIFLLTPYLLSAQNLPREWIILFECIHANQKKLNPDIFSAINSKLTQFNASLNHIPPERVSPLMKALLYRKLLETPHFKTNNSDVRSMVYIEKFFSEFEKKYKAESCSFTSWIVESMQSDLKQIQRGGGFSNNLSSDAKGVTIQQYISHWINFLQKSFENGDTSIVNYYGSILVDIEKILKNFSLFAPPQPTSITYIHWTFGNTFTENKQVDVPILEDEKSASEILEKNLSEEPKNNKTKSEAIDDLIKSKKQEDKVEPMDF